MKRNPRSSVLVTFAMSRGKVVLVCVQGMSTPRSLQENRGRNFIVKERDFPGHTEA